MQRQVRTRCSWNSVRRRGGECEHGHDECEHGCDERGLALQTIIITVVLLAIAGAVAAVLLQRAGTETDRLEGETDRWTAITNETGCDMAGGVWNSVSGNCGAPGTVVHNANTVHALQDCHTNGRGNPDHTHTAPGGVDSDGDGDFDDAGDTAPTACNP